MPIKLKARDKKALEAELVQMISTLRVQIKLISKALRRDPTNASLHTEREEISVNLAEAEVIAKNLGLKVSDKRVRQALKRTVAEVSRASRMEARENPSDINQKVVGLVDGVEPADDSALRNDTSAATLVHDDVAEYHTRLMHDFVFFCQEILTIPYRPGMNDVRPDGGFGPFYLTSAQKQLAAHFIDVLFIQKKPLRVQEPKGRQLGNTTFLLAFGCWLTLTRRAYHAMLIIDKDEHLNTKRSTLIRWLKAAAKVPCFPGIERGGHTSKLIELSNHSRWFFESAQSVNPGTSEMVHFVIFSERPKWPRGRSNQIKESVLPGLPEKEFTVYVDESTALGLDEFYRDWKLNSTTDTGITPIFLPWYYSREYRTVPPPSCYNGEGFIYLNRDEDFGDWDVELSREITEEEYAKKYELDDDQVYWRREKILKAFSRNRSSFDQEYPTTPDHAFRVALFGFFSKTFIEYVESSGQYHGRHDIVDVGGHVDTNTVLHHMDLSPKLEPNQAEGHLFIRNHPRKGVKYFIGADVCEGKAVDGSKGTDDPDYTVMSVMDEDENVVALHISRLKPEEAWLPLLLLAKYYNMAWVNGERNSVGHTLLKFFWISLYPNNVIATKPESRPPVDRAWTVLNKANRKPALQDLRASWAEVFDRAMAFMGHRETTYRQVAAFIYNKTSGKPEASPGFHDDIILACAHALIAKNWRCGVRIAKKLPKPAAHVKTPAESDGFTIGDTDLGVDPWQSVQTGRVW